MNIRKFLVLFCLLFFAVNSYAADQRFSALVVNAKTGMVIHEDSANELRYPASLTKMMTIYLTFRALENKKLSPNQKLFVSDHASIQKPTKIGFKKGETISVKDALLSLVINSANDSAVVLAEAIGGSEPKFAVMMTNMAKKLGMNRTVFKNASGLPDKRQVTTAYDMARLGIALRRDYPEYYYLFSKTEFNYKGRKFLTHNRVTKKYQGADGLKTGFINASGFNLVTSAIRGDNSIVGVVMGGQTAKRRDDHMMMILDKAFYKLAAQNKNINYAQDKTKIKAKENNTKNIANDNNKQPQKNEASVAPIPKLSPAMPKAKPDNIVAKVKVKPRSLENKTSNPNINVANDNSKNAKSEERVVAETEPVERSPFVPMSSKQVRALYAVK